MRKHVLQSGCCLGWDDAVPEQGQLLATADAGHVDDPAVRQAHHPLDEANVEAWCATLRSGLRGRWCGAAEKLLVGAGRRLEVTPAVADGQVEPAGGAVGIQASASPA